MLIKLHLMRWDEMELFKCTWKEAAAGKVGEWSGKTLVSKFSRLGCLGPGSKLHYGGILRYDTMHTIMHNECIMPVMRYLVTQ